METRLLLKRWVPAIFWAVVIFVMSSLPGADFSAVKGENFTIRKLLHMVEYLVLTFCFYRATKSIPLSVMLTISYAASDEFHQTFVPNRTGKLVDVVVDGVASGVGGFILWKYYQNLPQRLKNWLIE